MHNTIKPIELLAPAKNAEIAIEAINCGADAIYIGASKFGARSVAGNSISEIKRVVDYAHLFNVRVYVTVNTIIKDSEIKDVENLISELYKIKVDALIIQDMGILELDIPPIALHASTQCDIRSINKAVFLEKCGFSQIVLARELTLSEIKEIKNNVNIPIETFIHGALCVSYSGKCHASEVLKQRSANRGECAQICRLPYDLFDGNRNLIIQNKHLLSLKDMNQYNQIESLLNAGVSSFKIEGRLKDKLYVINVVSAYRKHIDYIISQNPDKYVRSSAGRSLTSFNPQLNKSFNRDFTNYFLLKREIGGTKIASLDTPKSKGEQIGIIKECNGNKKFVVSSEVQLHNGDGLSFFDKNGIYSGLRANKVNGNVVYTLDSIDLIKGTKLYRTYDKEFDDLINSSSNSRKLKLNLCLKNISDKITLSATDEIGNAASVEVSNSIIYADKPQSSSQNRVLSKLGNTHFCINDISTLDNIFIPASLLAEKRREIIDLLISSQLNQYTTDKRKDPQPSNEYFKQELTFADNVSNKYAKKFYIEHGVSSIEDALEIKEPSEITGNERLMTTRYCIRRELGYCKRTKEGSKILDPLILKTNGFSLKVCFDCARCEMNIFRN